VDPATGVIRHPDGVTRARVYPVGVDVPELRERMTRPAAARAATRVDEQVGDRLLITRVERMEPAKNAVRGVLAFGDYLAAHPDMAGRVVHHVLAYSSRADLPGYRRYTAEVQAAVDAVNAHHGRTGWTPVLLDTVNDADRGLALLARADVLVVNPLRDGMNLIAKEGPAVNDRDAVLILSREAGAAEEIGDAALLVDPHDVGALAGAIAAAVAMDPGERRRRAVALRAAAGALPPKEWLSKVLADLAPAAFA
jgi:trehalose 6-phosphate synthase